MYYILKNDILLDADYSIKEPQDIPADLSFLTGSVISCKIDEPFVFKTTAVKDEEMVDFKDCSFPLMSKRFLTLLEEAGVDNLQVFPAIIEGEVDGTIWDQYVVVNVLGSIGCADLSKSTYSELMPGSYMFDELAIDIKKTKESLLFRLQEDKTTLVIAKSVLEHIVDNDPDDQITGWEFNDIIQ